MKKKNMYNKSDLIYNNKYRFYKYYRDSKKFDNLSFESIFPTRIF